MGELALANQGIDCRLSRMTISFFEDVYTVTFYPPPAQSTTMYIVKIDAKASTILSVTKNHKVIAARLGSNPS